MGVYKYNATDDELNPIAGATTYAENPIGSIIPFGGTTSPAGWLFCRGQELLRADYAELFEVIGTSFGAGDGSTTFNLPDLRGEFLRGAGTNSHSGQGNGGSVGEHQNSTVILGILSNKTGINITAKDGVLQSSNLDKQLSENVGVTNLNGSYQSTGNQPYGTIRPTNTSVNYIIKAERVAAPADFVAAIPKYTTDKVDWRDYGKFGIANLLEITNTTTSSKGVTFTKNYDNSVTISSSNVTGDVTWYLSDAFTLPLGSYRLTGAATGSTSSGYRLRMTKNGTVLPEVYTSSPSYEFEVTNTTDEYRVAIRIASSLTGSAIATTTFYPMLTHAEYTGEYSYAKTNLELTKSTQYSTEEIPVGTWIDGKTIYRKVVAINTGNGAETAHTTGLSSGDSIIGLVGYSTCAGVNIVPIPYVYDTTNSIGMLVKNDLKLYVIAKGSNQQNQNGYVVIEYTKTT